MFLAIFYVYFDFSQLFSVLLQNRSKFENSKIPKSGHFEVPGPISAMELSRAPTFTPKWFIFIGYLSNGSDFDQLKNPCFHLCWNCQQMSLKTRDHDVGNELREQNFEIGCWWFKEEFERSEKFFSNCFLTSF